MISAMYIARSTRAVELELRIIRRFLLFPENRAMREAFLAQEVADYEKGSEKFLAQEADRDSIDDLVHQVVVSRYKQELKSDLPHLIEFSENRLNQMEIILRYTLFEGFLGKIVGNILWEYPELKWVRPIHATKPFQFSKKLMTLEAERIAWTRHAVRAVDRLPWHQWEGDSPAPQGIHLSNYLSDAFGLSFSETELWPTLERLRQIRNYLIHESLKLTIQRDRMQEAEIYLGNFPAALVQKAMKPFPKACTEGSDEDDDDGAPGYVTLELFNEF